MLSQEGIRLLQEIAGNPEIDPKALIAALIEGIDTRPDAKEVYNRLGVRSANKALNLQKQANPSQVAGMFGVHLENPSQNPEKEFPGEFLKGDFLQYSRPKAGSIVVLLAPDKEGDLNLLLLKQKGKEGYQTVQGFFNATPSNKQFTPEELASYDKDLRDNALREMQEELRLDAEKIPGFQLFELGTAGLDELPKGSGHKTVAGFFAAVFPEKPMLADGTQDRAVAPGDQAEGHFQKMHWMKVKDIVYDPAADTLSSRKGEPLVTRPRFAEFFAKAVKRYYNEKSISTNKMDIDTAARLKGMQPLENPFGDNVAYAQTLSSTAALAAQMIRKDR